MIDPNLIQQNIGSTGTMPVAYIEELRKALEAGQTYNLEDASGGQALRIQSLDHTMQAVIQENKHFRLFNMLPKPKVSATVDEWTELTNVGGFLGGSTNTETGTIGEASGTYTRRVGLVKYLMTRRQVSFVLSLQNNLVDAEAQEYQNGALQLLTDAEYLCFEGDSSVVPSEFDGIWAQMRDGVNAGVIPSDHILNAAGKSLQSINLINDAAAIISSYGNFGTPTDIFMSQQVQADFDTGMDPAFRVPLTDVPGGGVSLGAPVVGIRTSWGNIRTQPDIFIREGNLLKPFSVQYSTQASANTTAYNTVTAATTTGAPGTGTQKWTAAQYGNYYYFVAPISQTGECTAVAASGGTGYGTPNGTNVPTITITHGSITSAITGFAIYRGRMGVNAAVADTRLVCRIPRSASSTTVFYDNNDDVPGTTKAFILNMTPSATAITWRQMLPMLKFPLYPTTSAIIPWAQLLFGYLRISKRKHIVAIKNILPENADWNPYA